MSVRPALPRPAFTVIVMPASLPAVALDPGPAAAAPDTWATGAPRSGQAGSPPALPAGTLNGFPRD